MNTPDLARRVFTPPRRCANCSAGLLWGRWCVDCVRMAAKAISAFVALVEFVEIVRLAIARFLL